MEWVAGIFVLVGIGALAFLSISMGGARIFEMPQINISARFASVGGLRSGASIKMAGVKVGSVSMISLKDYQAEVILAVDKDLKLPTDTIASIRTEGLLGESYVLLRPGGETEDLQEGGRIEQTEPAIDLIDLLVKYALDGGGDSSTTDNESLGSNSGPPELFD